MRWLREDSWSHQKAQGYIRRILKGKKREASKLQSDIVLELVVNVRDNKNGCTGVRSEAHLPLALAYSSKQQMFEEEYEEQKSKHLVKVLQNILL